MNYDKTVYIGVKDDFHRLFEVADRDVHENTELDALGSVPAEIKLYYRFWENLDFNITLRFQHSRERHQLAEIRGKQKKFYAAMTVACPA